ncbi:hypothetical protein Tco_1360552 [Tanacetum coccineum]
MSSSSSTSNWTDLFPPIAFVISLLLKEPHKLLQTQLGILSAALNIVFYHFLDPEIRYGYYRTEMHNLYVQLQQAMREMQVQEYTYRSRIHDLELELNERAVTGDCYKKAVVVFILVVFVMNFLIN